MKNISTLHFYLFLAFLMGLIPAITFVHMFAKDFISYHTLSQSFAQYGSYSFSPVTGYGTSQTGLQARAPLLPMILAVSTFSFGNSIFAIYLPFLLCRLLIVPLVFLVASYFLPLEIAFLASSMIIFFPKLQTFSLSAFEADSFVLVLYMMALMCYFGYKKTFRKLSLALCGLSLGSLSLVKELGLPISIGFICAVAIEQILNSTLRKKERLKNILTIFIPFFLVAAPFFLFTFLKEGGLYFSAVTVDKSLRYLPSNLPFLLMTFPNYIGLDGLNLHIFPIKNFLFNFVVLICLFSGFINLIIKKNFTLIFPVLFTVCALGVTTSLALGGKIVGNFELITILAFAMPIVAIAIFRGFLVVTNFFIGKLNFTQRHARLICLVLSMILMYKFINNFFSKPYTLDYAGDYYINFNTVLFDKGQFPTYSFSRDVEGNLIVNNMDLGITFIKNEYRSQKVPVFTNNFRTTIMVLTSLGVVYGLLISLLHTEKSFPFLQKKLKRFRRFFIL